MNNYTIYKLLDLKATSDANDFNSILEKYGLNNFKHRLLIRMATFEHWTSYKALKRTNNFKCKYKQIWLQP